MSKTWLQKALYTSKDPTERADQTTALWQQASQAIQDAKQLLEKQTELLTHKKGSK